MSKELQVIEELRRKAGELRQIVTSRDALINDLQREIQKLERQLSGEETLRCSGCGTPIEVFFTSPQIPVSRFIYYLRKGDKIPAIKLMRIELQCGLREAKDFVEAMMLLLPEN